MNFREFIDKYEVIPDDKMRMTEIADTEQLFRLIQSIPSPKAEPAMDCTSSCLKNRIQNYVMNKQII